MRYHRQTARRGRGWLWLLIILLIAAGYFLWYVTSYHRTPLVAEKAAKTKPNADKFIIAESPLRRDIYDRAMRPLALSLRSYSVDLRPMELEPGPAGIKRLLKIPGLKAKKIRRLLRTDQASVSVEKYISAAEADRIARLKISGIHLRADEHRFYPYGDAAAQILGFTKDGQGLAGVEFTYGSILSGDLLLGSKALEGAGINVSTLSGGAAVVLSLDVKLQILLEKSLSGLIKKRGAGSGMALLLNAANGEIEALANIPSYDPNRYWQYDSFNRRNRVLKDPVPIGGIFSYLQTAAALRSGQLKVPAASGPQKVIAHLVPRFMKLPVKAVTGLNKGVWQKIQAGVYYGPGLGAMQEVTAGPPRLTVNDLGGLAGTAFTTTVITPLTPVALVDLAAIFGRLVNGGNGLRPHLLYGLRLDGSKKILAAHFKTAASAELKLPDREFKHILQKCRIGAKGPIVLESLVKLADSEASSIEFKEVGEADKQGEKPPPEKKALYNSLSIGIQTGRTPLVLLIALDGLSNPGSGSLCGTAIRRVLRGRRLIYSRKSVANPARRDYFAAWQRWRIKNERADERGITKSSNGVMPDVRGYSLRRALRSLSGLKVKLVISGAGRVKSQQPRPGVRLRDNEVCRLRLRFLEIKQRADEHFGRGREKAAHR